MDSRRLPVGIQTFRQIREEGYCYVDKTAYARRLADDDGKHYFLSRPRHFGKSLFVDTLKELYSRTFQAHWFETATPRSLVDTLLRRGFSAPDLDAVHASEALLSSFDVDRIAPEALLFQTGYLTIADEERLDSSLRYRLRYPNREVRQGLNESLLDALAPNWRRSDGDAGGLRRQLAAKDWTGVEALCRRLLAGIPHDWQRRNEIARYEGYWSSVFYAWFQASLDGVVVEDATSRGRVYLSVRLAEDVYLFEFKVAERSDPGAALEQLRARGYANRYRAPGRAVHLIGVEISAASRELAAFDAVTCPER